MAQRYKGVGGRWGGRRQKPLGERHGATSCPQMVLTTQLGRKDTIPAEGRITGWLHPIGMAHSTGANVSVMVLQGCKSTSQKSRPIPVTESEADIPFTTSVTSNSHVPNRPHDESLRYFHQKLCAHLYLIDQWNLLQVIFI